MQRQDLANVANERLSTASSYSVSPLRNNRILADAAFHEFFKEECRHHEIMLATLHPNDIIALNIETHHSQVRGVLQDELVVKLFLGLSR